MPLPHEVVAGCIALMGIAICFVDRRVRNARPKFGRRRGDLMEPESDPYDEASRNRLAQKRLRILGTLVNDNHKLLPSDLTVGDLMTTVVRTACPLTTIAELRAMTIEYKIRHILVCNDDNELVGVVSDRDLRRVSLKLVASDLMAECPTTVSSDMLVNQAITVLLYGHISSLPVVDAGRLVGIITTTDVVMTLQCAMLAVEQMVRDLGAGNRPASATYSES
ncbi:MAG: CBS domain-containing protein [Planctomycetia bacterium]|nr:CBS domain-containing protein [Planctomycetia bacterium]